MSRDHQIQLCLTVLIFRDCCPFCQKSMKQDFQQHHDQEETKRAASSSINGLPSS